MPAPTVITATDFVTQSTEWFTGKTKQAIAEHGHAVLGLSGGSTPKPVYEQLGKMTDIDWSKVWIFLADDRFIRADDPKSNQFLLRSTLLRYAPIPESQVILPDTTLPVEDCVSQYGAQVQSLVETHGIDVLLLGMGDDGHIASLFPPLADEAFGPAPAIHTTTEKFDVLDRISLTLPILTQAHEALMLLKGDAKKKVWEEMMISTEGPSRWPMKMITGKMPVTVMMG